MFCETKAPKFAYKQTKQMKKNIYLTKFDDLSAIGLLYCSIIILLVGCYRVSWQKHRYTLCEH